MIHQISLRRRVRFEKLADLVRPDTSKIDLENFKRQGYSQVVFIPDPASTDDKCEVQSGNIYEIDELLKLDNPLFRIVHPNAFGKFEPYGKPNGQELETPLVLEQKPEIPPTTIQPPPPLPARV